MFQPMAWNATVGVHSPEPANETSKQTSWKASCHRYHPSISKSVLSKVEIRVVLRNAKATVCPLLPSQWLLLAPFKNEHPKFVWWRWLISRMESKARLTMRDISFEQTQSSITNQQSQRHVKGFRKHLSLGIMSFYENPKVPDQTTARPGSEAELVVGSLDQHPSVPIKFQTQWICWKFGKLNQEAINSEPQTSRIKQTYMLTPVSSFEAKWAPIQIYPNGSEWDKNI